MSSAEEFWNSLGGRKRYQTSPLLETQADEHPPRLFACSNKTGRFIVSVWGETVRVGLGTCRRSRSVFIYLQTQVILFTPHKVAFRVHDVKAQEYVMYPINQAAPKNTSCHAPVSACMWVDLLIDTSCRQKELFLI